MDDDDDDGLIWIDDHDDDRDDCVLWWKSLIYGFVPLSFFFLFLFFLSFDWRFCSFFGGGRSLALDKSPPNFSPFVIYLTFSSSISFICSLGAQNSWAPNSQSTLND